MLTQLQIYSRQALEKVHLATTFCVSNADDKRIGEIHENLVNAEIHLGLATTSIAKLLLEKRERDRAHD